jgi:hypothetical protein
MVHKALGLEFLASIIVAVLLAVLPITSVLYLVLSAIVFLLFLHLIWRATGARGYALRRRQLFCAAAALVLSGVLTWRWFVRFAGTQAAGPATAVTGNNNVVTGPVSGGQVAGVINNNLTNNFYSAPERLHRSPIFAEEANAHPIISIGCMNFAPIKGLLDRINGGEPTPFLSFSHAGTQTPIVSPYIKDGLLTADVTLFAPGQRYEALSLRGGKFSLLAPNWDVNASERAIEVVNESGVPIFQLVRSSSKHLRIDGLFRMTDAVLLLGRGGLFIQPILGEAANRFSPPPDFLPKMFRYPSWQHPGEMVEPQPPRPSCPSDNQGISAISDGVSFPILN